MGKSASQSQIIMKTEIFKLKSKFVEFAQIEYNKGTDVPNNIASSLCRVLHDHTNLKYSKVHNKYDLSINVYAYDNIDKVCFNIDIMPIHYQNKNTIFTEDMIDIIRLPYNKFVENDKFIE